MSGTFTYHGRVGLLTAMLDHSLTPFPGTLWVALVRNPHDGDDSTINLDEPNPDTGYQRAAIPSSSAGWEISDYGMATNVADLVFGTPNTTWGTLHGWALVDSDGLGSVIAFGDLTIANVIFEADDLNPVVLPVTIPAGALSLQLGDEFV